MKTSSIPEQKPSLSTAYGYLVTNLLVMPGMGSLMAKRMVSGICQVILTFIGVLITMGGFILLILALKALKLGEVDKMDMQSLKILGIGFGIFLIAWFWSLFTSLQIIKEAKQSDA